VPRRGNQTKDGGPGLTFRLILSSAIMG